MNNANASSTGGETPAPRSGDDAEVVEILNSMLESASSASITGERRSRGGSETAVSSSGIPMVASPWNMPRFPVTYRLLPRIPDIRSDLRYSPYNSRTLMQHLELVFSTWTSPYVEAYGMYRLFDALVTKMFRDSGRIYNLFLLDATICATASVGEVWYGPNDGNLSHRFGVRLRTFLQVIGRPYVLFIFDQRPSMPGGTVIEFELEYMHQKYRDKQVQLEIFARSPGLFEIGTERVTFISGRGVELTYPKVYRFHATTAASVSTSASSSDND